MMSKKKKPNTITIEQAKIDYQYIIQEAIQKKLWFKAKALNLWLSPYELQQGWEFGKYLFPVKYWDLGNPNEYLRPFEAAYRKAKNKYDYAHKRYQAYAKMLNKEPLNIL